jgi:lysozyme
MQSKMHKLEELIARGFTWKIPIEAVRLIANYEDCFLTAYKCPAGIWTIGWGETEGVIPGTTWTKEYADQRFNEQVNSFADSVSRMCTIYTNPQQLGALTSLAYNIGLGALRKSTVLRAHNAGDIAAASRAFNLFNKAKVNGVLNEVIGLIARRAAESALYLKTENVPYAEPVVQEVAPESTLSHSPISRAGVISVIAGVAATVGELFGGIIPVIRQAKDIADALNINPVMVVGVVIAGAGITSVYWRWKQRQGGWS